MDSCETSLEVSVGEDVVLEFSLFGVDGQLIERTGDVPLVLIAGESGQDQDATTSVVWITDPDDKSYRRRNVRGIFRPDSAATWTWKATIDTEWVTILEGSVTVA